MPTTLNSSGVQFPDGTTQTTAASGYAPSFGGVGCTTFVFCAANSNIAIGSTTAGSNLRYNYTNAVEVIRGKWIRGGYNAAYNNGGTALSGTWVRVTTGTLYTTTSGAYAETNWYLHMWMRIS